MQNVGLNEAQAGIKIARRNINNLRHADDTTLTAQSKEELKSLLMKVKKESEKAALKLNFQKVKIMASGPITTWQIDGENVETVRFHFLGLQNQCRRWLQPHLKLNDAWLPGRIAMTNLDSVLKSRDIILPTKVCVVKAMFFPVVMYGCEIWTIKKDWEPKNWCFWTVVLKKSLESPLDCKEFQPVHFLKEISPEYSLERLMLQLKLQYFGHLMGRTD